MAKRVAVCAATTNNRVEVRVATPVFNLRRRLARDRLATERLVVGAVILWHVGARLWSGPTPLMVAGHALLALGGSFLSRGYGRLSLE
jgi:hypothetical protein